MHVLIHAAGSFGGPATFFVLIAGILWIMAGKCMSHHAGLFFCWLTVQKSEPSRTQIPYQKGLQSIQLAQTPPYTLNPNQEVGDPNNDKIKRTHTHTRTHMQMLNIKSAPQHKVFYAEYLILRVGGGCLNFVRRQYIEARDSAIEVLPVPRLGFHWRITIFELPASTLISTCTRPPPEPS